jgi:glycine betaine/proline transport system substrate-binding protein
LKSVTQLNDYEDALGGKLYDADPGWVTTEQNTARLKGYEIDFEHVVAGEAAELAQLGRAYRRQEPILVYLYHPHWVFSAYDMTQLKEGQPYEPDCFTQGDGACAMPAYSANIAASKKLAEQAPRFVALLRDFRIPLGEMEEMLKAVDVEKKDVNATAAQWVDKHAQQIDSWAKASG